MTVSLITATNVVLNAVITVKVQHFHNAIGPLEIGIQTKYNQSKIQIYI